MDYKRECLTSMIYYIDFNVDMLKAECKEYEKVVFMSNKMLKFQIFVPLIVGFIGFVYGGLLNTSNFFAYSIYGALSGFSGSIIPVLISTVYFAISKKVYNKKISKINNEINVSLEVKKKVEEEIMRLEERKNVSSKDDNDISSVKEYQTIIEQTLKENSNEKNKVKKLTLKKRR